MIVQGWEAVDTLVDGCDHGALPLEFFAGTYVRAGAQDVSGRLQSAKGRFEFGKFERATTMAQGLSEDIVVASDGDTLENVIFCVGQGRFGAGEGLVVL
jgi:hypothetical protein